MPCTVDIYIHALAKLWSTGEGQRPRRCKANRQRLSAQSRKRRSVRQTLFAGERSRRARPCPGANPAAADVQTGRQHSDKVGRLCRSVPRRFQVLHHHEAAQPSLHAGGVHEGFSGQFHTLSWVGAICSLTVCIFIHKFHLCTEVKLV